MPVPDVTADSSALVMYKAIYEHTPEPNHIAVMFVTRATLHTVALGNIINHIVKEKTQLLNETGHEMVETVVY